MNKLCRLCRIDQPPGFIEDGISINWSIKLDATLCGWLEYDWCQFLNTRCNYDKCPYKLRNSITIIEKDSP